MNKQTFDYNLFRKLDGNRKLNLTSSKYKQLLSSMIKRGGNLEPILVNRNYKVIDGQHRLYVCKSHSFPVVYNVVDVDDEEAKKIAAELNTTGKNWEPIDHIENKVEMGHRDITRLKEEIDFWSFKFSPAVVGNVFSLRKGGFASGVASGDYEYDAFGKYILKVGSTIVDSLKDRYFKQRAFMVTLKIIIVNNPHFDENLFVEQCKKREFFKRTRQSEIYRQIVEVYNYNLKKKSNKIK